MTKEIYFVNDLQVSVDVGFTVCGYRATLLFTINMILDKGVIEIKLNKYNCIYLYYFSILSRIIPLSCYFAINIVIYQSNILRILSYTYYSRQIYQKHKTNMLNTLLTLILILSLILLSIPIILKLLLKSFNC